MSAPLPIPGHWCLARRLVRDRTPGGRALSDMLYKSPYSDRFWAASERYRKADQQQAASRQVRRRRQYYGEQE